MAVPAAKRRVTSQKLRVKVIVSKQQGLVMIKLVIVRRDRPLTGDAQ